MDEEKREDTNPIFCCDWDMAFKTLLAEALKLLFSFLELAFHEKIKCYHSVSLLSGELNKKNQIWIN